MRRASVMAVAVVLTAALLAAAARAGTTVTLLPATGALIVGQRDTVIGTVRKGGVVCTTCTVSFRVLDTTRLRLVGTFLTAGHTRTNAAIVVARAAGKGRLRGGYNGVRDTTTWTITDSVPALTVTGIFVRPESVVVDTSAKVQFCSAVRMSDDSVRLVDNSKGVAQCDSVFRDLATYTTSTAWQADHDTVHVAVDQEPIREQGPSGQLGPVRLMLHTRILDAIRRPNGEWIPVRPVRGGRLVT